jgi:hypothetical protein
MDPPYDALHMVRAAAICGGRAADSTALRRRAHKARLRPPAPYRPAVVMDRKADQIAPLLHSHGLCAAHAGIRWLQPNTSEKLHFSNKKQLRMKSILCSDCS